VQGRVNRFRLKTGQYYPFLKPADVDNIRKNENGNNFIRIFETGNKFFEKCSEPASRGYKIFFVRLGVSKVLCGGSIVQHGEVRKE
jgi:hypothetical protein